jgi:DNA modification methylase
MNAYSVNVQLLNDDLKDKPAFDYGSIKKSVGRHGENTPRKNHHPTVKPILLMKYLICLVTPKNGLVLDPFLGSGSTGIAAKTLGYRFVGIEQNKEYFEIAKKRIEKTQENLL